MLFPSDVELQSLIDEIDPMYIWIRLNAVTVLNVYHQICSFRYGKSLIHSKFIEIIFLLRWAWLIELEMYLKFIKIILCYLYITSFDIDSSISLLRFISSVTRLPKSHNTNRGRLTKFG